MTKEVTRKPKPAKGDGISGLEDLTAPDRSMDRLEAIAQTEVHVELAPNTTQQRQFSPNLLAAAPGTRDHRFDGLRGEDRIAAAVEIGGLASLGQDMGLEDGTTLGEVERLRMGGAEGISDMEDNPQLRAYAAGAKVANPDFDIDANQHDEEVRKDINYINDEFYDGHRFHVVRTIGHYGPTGGTVLCDFSTVGDNDELENSGFVESVDDLMQKLMPAVSSSGGGGKGRDAEKLFRSWRTLGGSFDLESVGEIAIVKARNGVNMAQLFAIAFLGGLGALCFMIAALYIFGPLLPSLTD